MGMITAKNTGGDMTTTLVEFKVYNGQAWEKTPIHCTIPFTGYRVRMSIIKKAHRMAMELSRLYNRKVRYNLQGGSQGYYVEVTE